ncbi:bacteriohemerythrin [Roseospira goensis]|uniref:Hemerythrin-like metal-binding protein n=1 Tax=Roseospira goensis TaxID=391922 RepID=A0A7W6RYC6_9PROT|nr:bacteriohemerythrin [Roseospira goensis]MBB4285503.1 hemerythrin-like metal-binding protein [Roseospira goensis]
MAYLNWSDDLETGIEMVDQDHRVLVDLLNQAHDCIGAGEETATLGSVLHALVDYTEYHFAREERLMQAARYPELPAHRELHQRLARQARDIRGRYAAQPDSVNAREVMEFLRTWLIDHILKQDFRYRPAVTAHPEAVRLASAITFDGNRPAAVNEDGPPVPEPVDFRAHSVLVVDDNPNFQIILRTILKGLGCPSVVLADSASAGLTALESHTPTLMLVDWRMDGMDGLGFVREARRRGIAVPIVMISGYSEPGFDKTAQAAGVDAFLEKPITARNLVDTVSRAVGPG